MFSHFFTPNGPSAFAFWACATGRRAGVSDAFVVTVCGARTLLPQAVATELAACFETCVAALNRMALATELSARFFRLSCNSVKPKTVIMDTCVYIYIHACIHTFSYAHVYTIGRSMCTNIYYPCVQIYTQHVDLETSIHLYI